MKRRRALYLRFKKRLAGWSSVITSCRHYHSCADHLLVRPYSYLHCQTILGESRTERMRHVRFQAPFRYGVQKAGSEITHQLRVCQKIIIVCRVEYIPINRIMDSKRALHNGATGVWPAIKSPTQAALSSIISVSVTKQSTAIKLSRAPSENIPIILVIGSSSQQLIFRIQSDHQSAWLLKSPRPIRRLCSKRRADPLSSRRSRPSSLRRARFSSRSRLVVFVTPRLLFSRRRLELHCKIDYRMALPQN